MPRTRGAEPPLRVEQMVDELRQALRSPGKGYLRPFEMAGLMQVRYLSPLDRDGLRQAAASLTDDEVEHAMFQFIVAEGCRELRPEQRTPLGNGVRAALLDEAVRRGMLVIEPQTCLLEEGDTRDRTLTCAMRGRGYPGVDGAALRETLEAVLRLFRTGQLSERETAALKVFTLGRLLTPRRRAILPGRDQEMLRRPLPAALAAKLDEELEEVRRPTQPPPPGEAESMAGPSRRGNEAGPGWGDSEVLHALVACHWLHSLEEAAGKDAE